MENDAPFTNAVRLRGSRSDRWYRVTYSSSGVDITAPVTLGSYTTPELAPGASIMVKVQVKARAGGPIGSSHAGTVTLRSATPPPQKDVVGFTTRRG